jgi:hypothetical protein
VQLCLSQSEYYTLQGVYIIQPSIKTESTETTFLLPLIDFFLFYVANVTHMISLFYKLFFFCQGMFINKGFTVKESKECPGNGSMCFIVMDRYRRATKHTAHIF